MSPDLDCIRQLKSKINLEPILVVSAFPYSRKTLAIRNVIEESFKKDYAELIHPNDLQDLKTKQLIYLQLPNYLKSLSKQEIESYSNFIKYVDKNRRLFKFVIIEGREHVINTILSSNQKHLRFRDLLHNLILNPIRGTNKVDQSVSINRFTFSFQEKDVRDYVAALGGCDERHFNEILDYSKISLDRKLAYIPPLISGAIDIIKNSKNLSKKFKEISEAEKSFKISQRKLKSFAKLSNISLDIVDDFFQNSIVRSNILMCSFPL